jgi:hypothetical protein
VLEDDTWGVMQGFEADDHSGFTLSHKYIGFPDAAEVANWYFFDGQYGYHEFENM